MSKKVTAAGPQGVKTSGGAAQPRKKDLQKTRKESKSRPEPWVTRAAIRETVESIVIAFVLAFLFRAFEAEAFVIPTGSMATTLMGRHKDVTCPKCGFEYQVGASEEVDAATNAPNGARVAGGICPICRYAMSFEPTAGGKVFDSFNGDRIIVVKYPYHIGDPKRYDIVVFQYPGEAKTNYIKRLLGLPNETLRIHQGDVFAKPGGESKFTIARKPASKILAMMRPVDDNDCQPADLRAAGYPSRWYDREAARSSPGPGQWRADAEGKSFAFEGVDDAWLCYQHLPPSGDLWAEALVEGRIASPLKPQLITDFAGYNTQLGERPRDNQANVENLMDTLAEQHLQRLGLHWVGDLIVEATVEVQRASGAVELMLVKAGRRHVCTIDLASGAATLQVEGLTNFQPKAATKLSKPGKYKLRFANVDGQLHLWVNGSVASFDAPTTFEAPDDEPPNNDDLRPVRIHARDTSLRVSHLRIFRDIYYIACKAASRNENSGMWDFPDLAVFRSSTSEDVYNRRPTPDEVAKFYSDPSQWHHLKRLKTAEFEMKADEFFMLGDNSPESKDGRLWEGPSSGTPREHFVRRGLVKGKAIYIYWPHSWDRVPGTDSWASFPNGVPLWCFPNFGRMAFIR